MWRNIKMKVSQKVFTLLGFVVLNLVAQNACDQTSNEVELAQIVLSVDGGKSIKIVPLDHNNNLLVNTTSGSVNLIEQSTSQSGSEAAGSAVSTAQLSGAIQNLSAQTLLNLTQSNIIFSLGTDAVSLPQSAILYNPEHLFATCNNTTKTYTSYNDKVDYLANNQVDDINTKVFAALGQIVKSGSSWKPSSLDSLFGGNKTSAAAQVLKDDSASCPNNTTVCFYASELKSVSKLLAQYKSDLQAGLFTILGNQSSVVSYSSQQTSSSSTLNPDVQLAYNLLLKLITLYLYSRPATHVDQFILPSCGAVSIFTDTSNSILSINTSVGTQQTALQTASANLLTCLQANDAITSSAINNTNNFATVDSCCDNNPFDVSSCKNGGSLNNCLGSFLSYSTLNTANNNKCGSTFSDYTSANSQMAGLIAQMYATVNDYLNNLNDKGASIITNKAYIIDGLTVSGKKLSPCVESGSSVPLTTYGVNAKLVKGIGVRNYGYQSSTQPYSTKNIDQLVRIDDKGNQLYMLGANDGKTTWPVYFVNSKGQPLFMDQNNAIYGAWDPKDDSDTIVQYFWLAADGKVYPSQASCQTATTAFNKTLSKNEPQHICVPVSLCPSDTSIDCTILNAESAAQTAVSNGNKNSINYSFSYQPYLVGVRVVYNTICPIQQDIAVQLAEQQATCSGILSPADVQNLDSQQIKAIQAKQSAESRQAEAAFQSANGMVVMGIAFPLMGMVFEKLKSFFWDYLPDKFKAGKLGVTIDEYRTIKNIASSQKVSEADAKTAYEKFKDYKLTDEQLKDAITNMKNNPNLEPKQIIDAMKVQANTDVSFSDALKISSLENAGVSPEAAQNLVDNNITTDQVKTITDGLAAATPNEIKVFNATAQTTKTIGKVLARVNSFASQERILKSDFANLANKTIQEITDLTPDALSGMENEFVKVDGTTYKYLGEMDGKYKFATVSEEGQVEESWGEFDEESGKISIEEGGATTGEEGGEISAPIAEGVVA